MIRKLVKKRIYRPEAIRLIAKDWLGGRGPVLANHVHLREAADWILRAQAATPDDGVSGGYSFEDGWIASYPETTGYIIPTLVEYSDYSGSAIYRQRAVAMAQWVCTCQLDSGAFPGHFVDQQNPPAVFNTGQVIFGLLAAYRETGQENFLTTAIRAGHWLVKVQDADGAFRRFDYRSEVHSYNTRTAWALVELGLVRKNQSFLDAGLANLDWALGEQQKNGWFHHAAFSPNEDPFLHTIAYVAQGLLEAGVRLNRSDYIRAAELTCRAVLRLVGSNGYIPGTFDQHWTPTARYSCLTGNAQMSVLWLRLYQLTKDRIYRDTANRTLRFLKSLQDCHSPNPCTRGGIKGSHPISGRYLFGTYPNWAAKFFMDALLLEEQIDEERSRSRTRELRALVFTSLYPNNVWRHHGVFIKERMTQFANLEGCEAKIVAPVPYFPPLKINRRWPYSQVIKREIVEGLDVHHPRYFMIPKVGMALQGLMMFLSIFRFIRGIQTDFDFDLIDAHYVYPDGFVAVLLGHMLRKPVVVSARGSDINLYSEFPLIRKLLRFTLRRAAKVIAVSTALKQAITRLGIPEDKVSVIPNGVDQQKFYPIDKQEARKKVGFSEQTVILSVGSLDPEKGFDMLIKAFDLLVKESPEKNLHLVLVGEGDDRNKLERLIDGLGLNSLVRLVGDVSHHELVHWYNAADLFCLASSREGWPNVILESLACGTPVVATQVGGIPEIICSEDLGLIVNRSEHEIARGLHFALQKDWQSEKIVQYAAEHTWDEVAENVRGVFEAVIENRVGQDVVEQKEPLTLQLK